MTMPDVTSGLARSLEPRGELRRDLVVGPWTIRFDGLDGETAGILDARWGGFLRAGGDDPSTSVVHVRRAAAELPLITAAAGESYRIEAAADAGSIAARSYSFAIGGKTGSPFRLAVTDGGWEPSGRVYDNAARWIVARLAVEAGGLAFHGAGILRGGRAFVFAGPSGAGKSTAARLSPGAVGLGDDFAAAIPDGNGWGVPALPFDNAETAPAAPPAGLFPLAGVYRLYQAGQARASRPTAPLAHASLLSCVAFPWALPDLASRIDVAVDALIAARRFSHLEFAIDPGFWSAIEADL